MKLTARYKNWPKGGFEDDISTDGTYKVRTLDESNSGKKYVHLWGFKSSCKLEEVDLMIDGKVVTWD